MLYRSLLIIINRCLIAFSSVSSKIALWHRCVDMNFLCHCSQSPTSILLTDVACEQARVWFRSKGKLYSLIKVWAVQAWTLGYMLSPNGPGQGNFIGFLLVHSAHCRHLELQPLPSRDSGLRARCEASVCVTLWTSKTRLSKKKKFRLWLPRFYFYFYSLSLWGHTHSIWRIPG